MTSEVRNLKGEIVSGTDPEDSWWHFDYSFWLLIGGLFLFNIGCFFNPNLIDDIFRMLDVRLWPWSYCFILGVVVLFSVKWFLIYSRWEDYDGTEADAAMRFVRLSIFITAGFPVAPYMKDHRLPDAIQLGGREIGKHSSVNTEMFSGINKLFGTAPLVGANELGGDIILEFC